MTLSFKPASTLKTGDMILYGGAGIQSAAVAISADTNAGQTELLIDAGPYGHRIIVLHEDTLVAVLER